MAVTITKNSDGSIIVTAETVDEATKAIAAIEKPNDIKPEKTPPHRFGSFQIPADYRVKGMIDFNPS